MSSPGGIKNTKCLFAAGMLVSCVTLDIQRSSSCHMTEDSRKFLIRHVSPASVLNSLKVTGRLSNNTVKIIKY